MILQRPSMFPIIQLKRAARSSADGPAHTALVINKYHIYAIAVQLAFVQTNLSPQ